MGILIVFEGIDGAGKTTQTKLLSDALRLAGESVVQSKEPTDGPWGQKIRESANNGRMSLKDELNAFIEDRKEHVTNLIKPSLDSDKIVILDRYYYSTIAYQGARGANQETITKIVRAFAPIPDIVFLLDIEPEIGLKRISQNRGESPNHFEKIKTLRKVRTIFDNLSQTQEHVQKIDGHYSIQDVYKKVVEILINVLKTKYRAKSYDCDCWYCSYRETDSCHWLNMRQSLLNSAKSLATLS